MNLYRFVIDNDEGEHTDVILSNKKKLTQEQFETLFRRAQVYVITRLIKVGEDYSRTHIADLITEYLVQNEGFEEPEIIEHGVSDTPYWPWGWDKDWTRALEGLDTLKKEFEEFMLKVFPHWANYDDSDMDVEPEDDEW